MIELLTSRCAFCKNKNVNYLEKNFRFKTSSVCKHQICSACFTGPLFRNKKVVDCPECGTAIKMTQFSDKSKEELEYEQEVKVRREVLSKFNLEREDFDSAQEYLDYKELAEQLVWNKLHGLEPEWTREQIEANERDNRAKIARRAAIRAKQDRQFADDQRREREQRLEELKLLRLREMRERLEKLQERAEGDKVALGELRATTAALERAEKERKEREQREREQAAIEGGYGPQQVQYADPAQLWPPHQLEAQPKPQKSQPDPAFESLSALALSTARREAGGADDKAVSERTLQLMVQGLLL